MLFEDLFGERSPEELEAIRQKYAIKGNLFEAPALIADKARGILRHYVTNILPNGLKAQVRDFVRRKRMWVYRQLARKDKECAQLRLPSPSDDQRPGDSKPPHSPPQLCH